MKRVALVWVEVVALIVDRHGERVPRGLPCRLYVPTTREEGPSANRLAPESVDAPSLRASARSSEVCPSTFNAVRSLTHELGRSGSPSYGVRNAPTVSREGGLSKLRFQIERRST